MTTVVFQREDEQSRWATIVVYFGSEKFTLSDGQTRKFVVQPGRYDVTLRLSRFTSHAQVVLRRRIEIANELILLRCGLNFGFWTPTSEIWCEEQRFEVVAEAKRT